MAEYIEREAALKILRGNAAAKYPSSFYMGLFAAADEVSKIPTADVVEVVRCKDCTFCVIHKGVPFCIKWRTFPEVTLDDYCSYGERRDTDA